MAYSGHWNSTDQVPQHAVTEGIIDRFGSLDPSDGGETRRASLSFNRVARTDTDQVQFSAYLIRYQLDLWSTFTYYLKDPVNGDQMLQHDDRVVYGFNGSKTWFTQAWGRPTTILLGAQGRLDDIRDVAIDATVARQYLSTQQDAGVRESNAALYAEASTIWSPTLRTILGLRDDQFWFNVRDKMRNPDGSCDSHSDPLGCNTGAASANIASPKLGVVLGPWRGTSYFVTVAEGYHSNDARGITRSGANADAPPVTPLTRAVSGELGLSATPVPRWQTTLDAFALRLRSELVFDGDAGVTTPSGATTRIGIESGNTFRISSWLHADLNAAFSRARFDHNTAPDDLGCDDAAPSHPCTQPIAITGRYIPNSPTNVIDAGLTAQHPVRLVRRAEGAAFRRSAAHGGQQREVSGLHDGRPAAGLPAAPASGWWRRTSSICSTPSGTTSSTTTSRGCSTKPRHPPISWSTREYPGPCAFTSNTSCEAACSTAIVQACVVPGAERTCRNPLCALLPQ